jgi:hypothetical protein
MFCLPTYLPYNNVSENTCIFAWPSVCKFYYGILILDKLFRNNPKVYSKMSQIYQIIITNLK